MRRPAHPGRHKRPGFATLAGVWAAAGPLVAVDRAVAAAVNASVAPHPPLVAGWGAVTSLGADLTAAVVLTTPAAALLLRRRPRLALYVAVAGVGGAVITPALEELVARLRPVVEAPVAVAPGPSSPSPPFRPGRSGPPWAPGWRSPCSSG